MLVHTEKKFPYGYTPVAEIDGAHANMLMDFGILKIQAGSTSKSREEKERAFLLMDGSVEFRWKNKTKKARRVSLLEENPHVLHLQAGEEAEIIAETDVEMCVQKVSNFQEFDSLCYTPEMIRSQRFGEGTMQDTSTRIVRTVFDAENAPLSGMVIGEVINYPGKWSSYPPHNHPQPEIYHYRFPTAPQGFGFGEVGGNVYKIKHQSTLMIKPWVTHPQTAAPGYPMYYIWMIPHLQDNKFGPDSRRFIDEHKWLLDSNAKIWPDTI